MEEPEKPTNRNCWLLGEVVDNFDIPAKQTRARNLVVSWVQTFQCRDIRTYALALAEDGQLEVSSTRLRSLCGCRGKEVGIYWCVSAATYDRVTPVTYIRRTCNPWYLRVSYIWNRLSLPSPAAPLSWGGCHRQRDVSATRRLCPPVSLDFN
jgi:hypothetical protein